MRRVKDICTRRGLCRIKGMTKWTKELSERSDKNAEHTTDER